VSIGQLMAVVTPPKHPIEVSPVEGWERAQKELGITLPPDYLEFALTYGSGSFDSPMWLEVWNPLSSRFIDRVQGVLDALRMPQSSTFRPPTPPLWGPNGYALELNPARPGVLPIGNSIDGMRLCYYTIGEPKWWPLLLVERADRVVHPFPGPLTSLLAQLHSEPLRTLMACYGDPSEPGQERGPARFKPQSIA
jgi:SMI1 / KNR4 family (SUKH-1)